MKSIFDPRKIDITHEQSSLAQLLMLIEDGVIKLTHEFKRKSNIWDEKKMEYFIESILLQVPTPALYFDASRGNHEWLVIDGLQRLITLKRFVIDKDNPLVLSSLNLLTDLNGKSYTDLDINLRRRIERSQVMTYVIKPNTPKIVVQDIFKRIQQAE